ncbi:MULTISPECIES: DotU family type IV/VI secretion system protein [Burkholderia]|uniref:DotU family type IV/VI secretion system protein n=1 Tax=Burkholderia TaxID=32008 RepID=UPI0007534521|nr:MULTISPECIES: DotU family type IV/VI secretion system protein [Burkholderia]AOJ73482.1 type VI secretion system protein ImpK [Burkholderia savannae]KVG41376.1 type VI secretion system protein ImpK [Burkholderia sp. MSMB0265]KVG87895.1 type VI secretion system protein ImpK [Burkholderia sp. MSMB2040]KVG96466.1 type VI secretion system protein ImpK [Burkholderia sp. MSMB2041]KVH01613.1 type VI secretion system protein ImpK [Burkholderia sp. MSMB2042]
MKLSDSMMPLVAYARQFAQHPRGDAAEVALRFEYLIESARDHAACAGVSEIDVDHALFAVCAWIDEALLNSGWDNADRWTLRLLQKHYFDTSHAGVEFFERLETLDGERADVLEVFLLCLQLGFRGRYGYDGGSRPLDVIRQRAIEALSAEAASRAEGEPLFPAAYTGIESHATVAKARAHRRIRLAGLNFGVPLAILLSLYVIFHVVIARMVDSVLPTLQ